MRYTRWIARTLLLCGALLGAQQAVAAEVQQGKEFTAHLVAHHKDGTIYDDAWAVNAQLSWLGGGAQLVSQAGTKAVFKATGRIGSNAAVNVSVAWPNGTQTPPIGAVIAIAASDPTPPKPSVPLVVTPAAKPTTPSLAPVADLNLDGFSLELAPR